MKLTDSERKAAMKLYCLITSAYKETVIELRNADDRTLVKDSPAPPLLLRTMIANTISNYLLKSEENLK